MIRAALILALIFISCYPERSEGAALEQPGQAEDALIRQVRFLPISRIAATLGDRPVASWLRAVAGAAAQIEWAVGKCVLKSGAELGREQCSSVTAQIQQPNGAEAIVEIAVEPFPSPNTAPHMRVAKVSVKPASAGWRDVPSLDELQVLLAHARVTFRRVDRLIGAQYPDDAQDARMQGTVFATLDVTAEGNVAAVTAEGHPTFVKAAATALEQWVFAPAETATQEEVAVVFHLEDRRCAHSPCKGEPVPRDEILVADFPGFVKVNTPVPCVCSVSH